MSLPSRRRLLLLGAGAVSATGRGWPWGWIATLVVSLLLIAAATVPPWLPPSAREVLMHAFAPVCHQLPGRSPQVDGVAFAVCHRCYGIYLGLPLALVAFWGLLGRASWLHRHARWILAASLVPIAIDWGGDWLGWWTNTPASRMATGGVFGLVAGLYLAHAVLESRLTSTPPGG